MRTIPAKEIKRRGISAVDALLAEGSPVYVIRNDRPDYVILDLATYEEMLEQAREGFLAGVRRSRAEEREGEARSVTADEMIQAFGLESTVRGDQPG